MGRPAGAVQAPARHVLPLEREIRSGRSPSHGIPSRSLAVTVRPGACPAPEAEPRARPMGRMLGSRDDVRLEQLVDSVSRIASSLAVSLKAYRKRPENVVYRTSVEQQYREGLGELEALVRIPVVIVDDECARIAIAGSDAFLGLCPQVDWLPVKGDLAALFERCAATAYDREHVLAEGRPCATYEGLVACHVRVPVGTPVPQPEETPGDGQVGVLHETSFTYRPDGGREALLPLLVPYLVHVKGRTREQAVAEATPAVLMGFEQAVSRALAGRQGLVHYAIVKDAGGVRVVIKRMAGITVGT